LNKPELLAPAGGIEQAYAAINAGADAVYIGGKSFSARGTAANFTLDEMETVINYAALRGASVFVAVNTLYKDEELPKVLDFAENVYKMGAKALILQDIGLAGILKKTLPNIELHASTQMSVHSGMGAKYLAGMGFKRVVLARELSLAEIIQINKEAPEIETEVFIHGALCISYSGQCLFSSLIGGRSGNRGLCAQPCRQVYDLIKEKSVAHGCLLSPKDICTLGILDETVKTGVKALKIEGRMKNATYVHLVTKAYREYLDNNKVTAETTRKITQIFNRGGSFTQGYYKIHSGYSMMSPITPKSTGIFIGRVAYCKKGICGIKLEENLSPGDGIEIWTKKTPHIGTNINKHGKKGEVFEAEVKGEISVGNAVYKSYDKKLSDETQAEIAKTKRQRPVQSYVVIKVAQEMKLTLCTGEVSVTATGCIVEQAKDKPTDIISQLSKTGDTPFIFNFDSEKSQIDKDVFIPVKELNKLRRDAVLKLEEGIIKSIKRQEIQIEIITNPCEQLKHNKSIIVQVSAFEQAKAVANTGISAIYLPFSTKVNEQISKLPKEMKIYVKFPHICRSADEEIIYRYLQETKNTHGFVVSTLGQLQLICDIFQEKLPPLVLDHNINIMNTEAIKFLKEVSHFSDIVATLSTELSIREMRNMPVNPAETEIIVYGNQTMMATHNCPVGNFVGYKNTKHCKLRNKNTNQYKLKDKLAEFPIITDCNSCTAYILNSKTLDMRGKISDLSIIPANRYRLIFTTESPHEAKKISESYLCEIESLSKNPVSANATYGHFYRGVI